MQNLSLHFILLSLKLDIFLIKMKKWFGALILQEVVDLFLRLGIVGWIFVSSLFELGVGDIEVMGSAFVDGLLDETL